VLLIQELAEEASEVRGVEVRAEDIAGDCIMVLSLEYSPGSRLPFQVVERLSLRGMSDFISSMQPEMVARLRTLKGSSGDGGASCSLCARWLARCFA
jgi:hypothetical protein